jgi:hypothetical protein
MVGIATIAEIIIILFALIVIDVNYRNELYFLLKIKVILFLEGIIYFYI